MDTVLSEALGSTTGDPIRSQHLEMEKDFWGSGCNTGPQKTPTLPAGQQNKLQPEACGSLRGGGIDTPPMCVLLSSEDDSVHCLT